MADIQIIQCQNQQKTSLSRRNMYKEIEVKEQNADVTIITGSS